MNRKSVVALLPMKANSERVKGKNFREFAGKPLFQWMLESLLGCKYIDKVVINTDARQLLLSHGLVESSRVVVRDRKPELCGDLVSMNLVIEDDVLNVSADTYLMTHTTNPLISSATIADAIECFEKRCKPTDSLFSVNRVQTRFYKRDMTPVNHDPSNLVRTQDLEPWFEENSCLYVFSRESFKLTRARIGRDPMIYETPRLESVDIDEEDDWYLAESLALRNS